MQGGAARPPRLLPQLRRQPSGRCSRVPAPAGIAQAPGRGGGESGRRGERASRLLEWGERGSWEALAEEAWRARPHSAPRGGSGGGSALALPPYVSEDGVRSTPRVEGGVRGVHGLTRSGADKGHLEADAIAARASAASSRASDSCSASAAGAPQATWPRPAELSPPPGSVPKPAKPQPDAPGLHSR
ncbi:hypothetical protein NN561_001595 [Cricetulus griseus]